ncbi:MAG: hypothetical protein K5985_08705 [Lachnospiraceae bacterium]|nr:hypothetical protein [Lachnospiraceae bacterium]
MKSLNEKLRKMILAALLSALVVNSVPGLAYGAEVTPEPEPEVVAEDAEMTDETGGSRDVVEAEKTEEEPVAEEESVPADSPVTEEVSDVPAAEDIAEEAEAVVPDGSPGYTEWTGSDSMPSDPGSYRLNQDVTLGSTWVLDGSVNNFTIDLNGHTIRLSAGSGSVIKVTNGAALTIEDNSGGPEGGITGGKGTDNSGGGVHVDGGTFNLKGGCIYGNSASNGGGVHVGNYGTFNMSGGNIYSNRSDTNHYGGGVHVNNGSFTMTGGNIFKNEVGTGNGGGVYFSSNLSDITFTMTGGSISGNTADYGGGVWIVSGEKSATFNMSGNAVISGNKANNYYSGGVYLCSYGKPVNFNMNGNAVIYGNNANTDGGGVYVGENCFFTMNGGYISENSANKCGGGIYVYDGGTFTMNGGSIAENSAKETGGGIFISDGKLNMSGSALVANNKAGNKKFAAGGVYINKGQLAMSGRAAVVGNTAEGSGSVGGIYVSKGSSLNLEDHARVEGNEAKEDASTGGIYIGDGQLTIKDNAVVSGNKGKFGGIVAEDLIIKDNVQICFNEGEKIGGVAVQNGDLQLEGGSIRNNKATSSESNGGGIAYSGSDKSTFIMSGEACIEGNEAESGGGVWSRGTFIMEGGSIKDNRARSDGGGIYIPMSMGVFGGATPDSIFDLRGGSIEGNEALRGGGIYNYFGDVILRGGKLTGNKADAGGGAVTSNLEISAGFEASLGTFTVTDGAYVTGNTLKNGTVPSNVFLFEDKDATMEGESSPLPVGDYVKPPVITVSGQLTGMIGVSSNFTKDGAVIASGNGIYEVTDKDAEHFSSTEEDYIKSFDPQNKTVVFVERPRENIPSDLTVEDLTYNGSDQTELKVRDMNGDVVDPAYYTASFNEIPHAVGSYTALLKGRKIYSGSVTKSFKVKEAPLTVVSADAVSRPYDRSSVVAINSVSLDGIMNDEKVYVDATGLKGTLSGSDTGEYDSVTLSGEMKLSGADSANYVIKKPEGPVSTRVTIYKADHENMQAEGRARYGTDGILELKDYVAEGGDTAIKTVSDPNGALSGNAALNGTMLTWSFKDDRSLVNKKADVVISVKNAKNYKDYIIHAALTVNDCSHSRTELRDVRRGTCSANGYSGDTWCLECGSMIRKGTETPKDPDNHYFDYKNGTEKIPATVLQMGVTTYECCWCHEATVDRTDIPCLPDKKDRDLEELRKDVADLSGNAVPVLDEKTDEKGNIVEETVTIGGEEISKIITDPESGKETVESKLWIGGLDVSYTYTGSKIKPELHVYDGLICLAEGTDYSLSFKNNKEAGKATATVKFKGNYKDNKEQTAGFDITPAILGKDILAHDVGVAYTKKTQKPVPVLTWASTGKAASAKDFTVTYDRTVKEAGEYTATIKAKNSNFTGETTARITVVKDKNKLLSKAKVSFDKKSYAYTGEGIVPKATLKLAGNTVPDNAYRMICCDNVLPGTARITFEALSANSGGYAGTKTATFKISGKRELKEAGSGSDFTYSYSKKVPVAKGGAKPEVSVKDGDTKLRPGKDYTLSYSKNKAVTNGSESAYVTVKGKGNYKGSVKLNFAVEPQSIGNINVTAADQFTSKSKLKKPSVTAVDIDGKKLKAGKDFTVDSKTEINGDESAGSVTVRVTGAGAYKDTVTVTFRYLGTASSNLAKTKKVKNIADQPYTGNPVTLSANDLSGILKSGNASLLYGTDFEVVNYSNNTKKGTAKVNLHGTGTLAGTKTLTFKITGKKASYQGVLIDGGWK